MSSQQDQPMTPPPASDQTSDTGTAQDVPDMRPASAADTTTSHNEPQAGAAATSDAPISEQPEAASVAGGAAAQRETPDDPGQMAEANASDRSANGQMP